MFQRVRSRSVTGRAAIASKQVLRSRVVQETNGDKAPGLFPGGPGGRQLGWRADDTLRDPHTSLMSLMSCWSELFASPKSMAVRGWKKSSFSTPLKPAAMLRFSTMMLLASSTFRIGIP